MIETFNTLSTNLSSVVGFTAPFIRNSAYLDPGSGSYLLQILLASLLGAAVVIRMSWGRIRGFFSRSQPDEKDDQGEESSED